MKTGLSGFKPKNGLTKREFFLVTLLLVVLEVYLLFTYVLQPSLNEYKAAETQLESTRAKLESLKTDFDRKAEMENQLKDLGSKYEEMVLQIPPYYSQEEAILLVDELSKKNMLSVQLINFDNAGVYTSVVDGDVPANVSSGLVSQDVTLSFYGSYPQIYSFLSDIESSLRKVAVKGIALQRNQGDRLTGQMKLSFVSYWEADGQQPYSMVTAPVPGKDSPFVPYLGYSEGSTRGTATVEAPDQPDFYMLVNGYMNNADKVILAQYKKVDSEASADVNGLVNASINLNGGNGRFTYDYKVGTESKAVAVPIEARDNKIRLEVVVQERKSDQDKVAVILDVNNNTDMPLEITVKGDNDANPRFSLGKTTGNVIVK